MVKKEKTHVDEARGKLSNLKNILRPGEDKIMKTYIRKKLCKKNAILLEKKYQMLTV